MHKTVLSSIVGFALTLAAGSTVSMASASADLSQPTSAAAESTKPDGSTTVADSIGEHLRQLDRKLHHQLRVIERRGVDDPAQQSEEIRRFGHHLRQMEGRIRGLGSPARKILSDKAQAIGRKLKALERATQLGPPSKTEDRGAESAVRIPLVKGVPATDDCANAMAIGDGTFLGTTVGATNDGAATCGGAAAPDVWFRYSSPVGGRIYFDTLGSEFDTVLSLHASCPGTELSQLTCNNDSTGLQSALDYFLLPGDEAWVRVSGAGGATGQFTLHVGAGGAASGRLTDRATGAPIASAGVQFLQTQGYSSFSATTDPQGNYTVTGMPGGSYYAIAGTSTNFIAELFDDLPCPEAQCDVSLGTPIDVTVNEITMGIDFALDFGGSIAGTVTDANTGEPLANLALQLTGEQGQDLDFRPTNEAGEYEFNGLPPGSYFVSTTSNGLYRDELFDDLPCPVNSCDRTSGTPVQVALSQTTTDIDFALDLLGSIAGVVTEEATGEPIPFLRVEVEDATSGFSTSGQTDEAGRYMIGGLATGDYFVRTRSFTDFLDELYDDVPCPTFTCNQELGTTVAVELSSTTPDIDFALKQLGAISGTVTDEVSGEPLPFFLVEAVSGLGFGAAFTDAAGHYTVGSLLPSDEYYVQTAEASEYQDELYDDIPCPTFTCVRETGTPVPVSVETTTEGIDFALDRLGSIAGTITDQATGEPIPFARVRAQDTSGLFSDSATADEAGNYLMTRLVPGSHYVLTEEFVNFRDELYDDIPCPFGICDLTTGTPVETSLGTTTEGIDFALDRFGAITGTVTDEATGESLEFYTVRLQNEDGSFSAVTSTNSDGQYRFDNLAPEALFVSTDGGSAYQDELYDNIPCPNNSCSPIGGMPVVVELGTTTEGIDFALRIGGVITGSVRSAAGNERITGDVFLWDAAGGLVLSTFSDFDTPYRFQGLAAGPYFVSTSFFRDESGNTSYNDELFDDIPCPLESCEVTTGTPVVVSLGETTPAIDFELSPMIEPTCVPSPTVLCLNQDRFQVEVRWRTVMGQTGDGQGVQLTSDTGYFWFFDPLNVELMVKVLDGCFDPFDSFWVFAGGLTDVEVDLTVTDTVTGEVRTYGNPLGSAFAPIQDFNAFAGCDAAGTVAGPGLAPARPIDPARAMARDVERLAAALAVPSFTGIDLQPLAAEAPTPTKSPGTCVPDATTLCLNEGRFAATALWDTGDEVGDGQAVLLTGDTGYFWFFSPDNVEAVVKVLNACDFGSFDNFWVFGAGLTEVKVTLRVTDTETQESQEWVNPQDTPFQPIRETDSFMTCP
ncbi:MAG: carboxypeptidase regulatory-like domain-containing protein [Acidobacteriota bacterium]